MPIQWFPGHMAKARRGVQEKLKLVDFVIELVDARAPFASENPMLKQILNQKPKMRVLMKKDLADPKVTHAFIDHFNGLGERAISVDVNRKEDIKKVVETAKLMAHDKMERMRKKGIKPRPARAMIIGIPNVGKSTLINRLANKKIAKTGDRPGVTTSQQWIKVKKDFELLDTPGILWPKFEDEVIGYRLACLGTIKDQILHMDDLAVFLLRYLQDHYPNVLMERYQIEDINQDIIPLFDHIGQLRGAIAPGNHVDYDKTAELIIRDYRSGKLGLISLERPEDASH